MLTVKEIEDVLLANCLDEDISMGQLRSIAKELHTAMVRRSPSPEARVDWEKEAKDLVYGAFWDWLSQKDSFFDQKILERTKIALQAAFEKGREAR